MQKRRSLVFKIYAFTCNCAYKMQFLIKLRCTGMCVSWCSMFREQFICLQLCGCHQRPSTHRGVNDGKCAPPYFNITRSAACCFLLPRARAHDAIITRPMPAVCTLNALTVHDRRLKICVSACALANDGR